MTNLLHYSPIDVWMFNAAPICNVGKYGDITTTRESVTCPDCNRILDAIDFPIERRKVETLNDIPFDDAWTYSSDKGKVTE